MKTSAYRKIIVPPVDRAVIDGWPLDDAGLSLRIVNAGEREGFATIAGLRAVPTERLLRIRSFGKGSLKDVREFFAFCNRLERGRAAFDSATDLLERFLSPTARKILTARHGLRAAKFKPGTGATLDAIGKRFGLTRERVRQQLVIINRDLRTRPARICLGALARHFSDFISSRGGVATAAEMAEAPFRDLLDGMNPAAFAQLLSEMDYGIMLRGGLFSVFPAELMDEIEKTAVDFLSRSPRPRKLSDLVADFEEKGWFRGQRGFSPRLVIRIVENNPAVGVTHDDHYFLFPDGAVYLLATLLSEFPTSAQHRVLIARFNEELKPASRRDADYITELLTRTSVFVRGRDGTYRLRR